MHSVARLLRSLGSVGAVGEVGEVGKEAYVPTKVTRTFVIPSLAAGVEFWYVTTLPYNILLPQPKGCPCMTFGKLYCSRGPPLFKNADNIISTASFDVLSPSWNNLPAYLKKSNYQNPTDVMNAAFHEAHNTTSHFIPFLDTKPDFQRSFQVYMTGFNEGRTSWTDFFPVEEELGKGARQDPQAIMFVDIGGGMGHEGLALKKRYPDLPGRFVNQDLAQIVSDQKLDGIESMAHDFFTPQPLKGKR